MSRVDEIPEEKPIMPKFRSQDQRDVMFMVMKNDQMKNTTEAYCAEFGLEHDQHDFFFDGRRIQPYHTPNQLRLEAGDEIDVYKTNREKKPEVSKTCITVKFQSQDHPEVLFTVCRSSCKMKTLIDSYCAKFGVDYRSYVFLFDGKRRLDHDKTPNQLEMEDGDGDVVDVFLIGDAGGAIIWMDFSFP